MILTNCGIVPFPFFLLSITEGPKEQKQPSPKAMKWPAPSEAGTQPRPASRGVTDPPAPAVPPRLLQALVLRTPCPP
ncbi:hypothetical protein BRADI_4g36505v3 [Brachypodium distachyon]|uniref:Uncharacterized protein n=1 Tax=Brachypodium distachyon TaxID=15368 RepID=A0A2K2CSM6_BRADI|nr:hypothetical protein BRADI_4g36505v3 [Brachypodium distachyon]